MKLTCENQKDNLAVLNIAGEMTGDDGERLRKDVSERLDQRVRDFVLDMSKLEFIDSRGLEALLWVQGRCNEELGQLRLAGLDQNVSQILNMTRLASRFTQRSDVEDAISSLG